MKITLDYKLEPSRTLLYFAAGFQITPFRNDQEAYLKKGTSSLRNWGITTTNQDGRATIFLSECPGVYSCITPCSCSSSQPPSPAAAPPPQPRHFHFVYWKDELGSWDSQRIYTVPITCYLSPTFFLQSLSSSSFFLFLYVKEELDSLLPSPSPPNPLKKNTLSLDYTTLLQWTRWDFYEWLEENTEAYVEEDEKTMTSFPILLFFAPARDDDVMNKKNRVKQHLESIGMVNLFWSRHRDLFA